MQTTKRTVKLSELKCDVCNGRGIQTTDSKNIQYLVSLLEAGVAFKNRVLVTSDLVVIGGHHRTEAYRQFFANLHKGNVEDFAAVTVDVDMLPQSWYDSSELQRMDLRMFATIDSNAHSSGRPYNPYDVRVLVGTMKNGPTKSTQKEIKAALSSRGVPDLWVTRAFRDLLDSETQRKLAAARGFKKEGYTPKEACEKAGLPIDTDLSTRRVHDKLRQNKIKKSLEAILRQWDFLFKEHRVRFDGGSITQEQYRNLFHTMRNEATRLQRKADSITKQIEEHLRDEAGRICTAKAA